MKGDVNKGVPGLYYLGAKEIFNMIEQVHFSSLSLNSDTCMLPSVSIKSTAVDSTIC
jgi:hypothetical protein